VRAFLEGHGSRDVGVICQRLHAVCPAGDSMFMILRTMLEQSGSIHPSDMAHTREYVMKVLHGASTKLQEDFRAKQQAQLEAERCAAESVNVVGHLEEKLRKALAGSAAMLAPASIAVATPQRGKELIRYGGKAYGHGSSTQAADGGSNPMHLAPETTSKEKTKRVSRSSIS